MTRPAVESCVEGLSGLPRRPPWSLTVRLLTSRSFAATLLAVGMIATPTVAIAHPQSLAPFEYVERELADVPVITDVDDLRVALVRRSDNVEFVAHVPVAPTSDMQFQRRIGSQRLKGEVVTGTRDILVMGGTQRPGLMTFDITDPKNPELLATVSCGGFHSDVAIYENYAIQAWDGTTRSCDADDPANRNGVENAMNQGSKGLRIYDITDPADPVMVARYGKDEGIPSGVHNITVNADAGLVYLNMAEFNAGNPPWGYVDMNDPELPVTIKSIRDWSPTAADGCHDGGIAPTRELFACPGITASYIWDISDPRNPTEVAYIPNPAISIHHGGRWTPDEQTLVLGDELAGAAAATPCSGGANTVTPTGAAWFYNATVAEAPVLSGVFSTPDTDGDFCTTHFYGFQRDTTLMPMGMYDAGIEVVDYAAVADGLPGVPTSHAVFEPDESGFFSAYAWHGYVYGSSFEYGATGKDLEADGRGLWIIKVDGIEDNEPVATDEGATWGRWTDATSGVHLTIAARIGLAPAAAHTNMPLYAIAGALALLVSGVVRRRRAAT
ncbi:MAG: hypothetical protein ACJA2H_001440 [Nitriliruptoraceae bacterium]|jgi:hypothetical protein